MPAIVLSINRHPVSIDMDKFLMESLRIVDVAKENDVVVRILGGFGIYIHAGHCGDCRPLQLRLGRLGDGNPAFTDLDLIGYSKQWGKIRDVLEKKAQLQPDRMINALYGNERLVYYHPQHKFPIDVFFDHLDYSHEVSFGEYKKGRLELDYPTLGLADLMLEKLQVHQINTKDLIDMIVLTLSHSISESPEAEAIDAKHISRTLAGDWGFWYDATQNLAHVKSYAKQVHGEGKMTEIQWKELEAKIAKLESIIEAEPKTDEWKVRSRVGTAKQWFKDVTDL